MGETLSGKASEFLKTVDGQKIIDFKMLEDQYGKNFMEIIKREFDFCLSEGNTWKIEIISKNEVATRLIFATQAYMYIFAVSHKYKRVMEQTYISRFDCREALKLMDECSKIHYSELGN